MSSTSKQLKDLSAFITKGATPTTYGFRWESSGVRFLRSECVSARGLDLTQSMFISEAANRMMSRSEVSDGDLLMTITGNVGRVVRVDGLPRANINQHIARIRLSNPAVDSGYVYHYLSQPAIREYYETITTGQAYPQISLAQVRETVIPLPPIEDQRHVAEILTEADCNITALERLISKKQAVKQGMLQQLLTGMTRLSGFSQTWRSFALGDVAKFSKGSGLPKSEMVVGGSAACIHYGELFSGYGVEITDVVNSTNHVDLPVRSRRLDVLMPTSDVTPRGLAKASAVLSSGVILGGDILIITPEDSEVFGPFLAWVIRHDANQVLQLVRGSTVFHIYASDMKHFSFSAPSVEEQRAICDVLRDVDKDLAYLESQLGKLEAVKQGMMQKLLPGRTRLIPAEAAA